MKKQKYAYNHTRSVNRFLKENKNNNITKVGTSFIPILIFESNRDITDNKNIDIVVSDTELTPMSKSAIKNVVYPEFSQLKWSQNTIFSQEIKNEFNKLLTVSSKSSRINDLALRMFQSNIYQNISFQQNNQQEQPD